MIREFQNVISTMKPEDLIILSHADHDGFTSTALIDCYFYKKFQQRIKKFHPSKETPYTKIFNEILKIKPKYLFLVDVVVSKYKNFLEKILQNNTVIVNLDHHDNIEISSENYINFNPHRFGLEFMNSSGLCWTFLKEIDEDFESLCWLAGIGAIQDYCIEDNKELFKTLKDYGYIDSLTLEYLIDSELMKIAKMINASIRAGYKDYVYQKIFDACLNNKIEILENDTIIIENYEAQERKINLIYERFKKEKITHNNLNFFDLKDSPISYISYIAERDKERKIYVGYSNGLIGFRSLFYEFDVRKLAKLFNGSGPHPKVADGKTKKSFEEVVKIVSNYFSQKSLDKFF